MNISNNKSCRLCLEVAFNKANIFSTYIEKVSAKELLAYFVPIEIEENDKLPSSICDKCFEKLNVLYQFREQIISSDLKLRLDLKNSGYESQTEANIKKDPSVEKYSAEQETETSNETETKNDKTNIPSNNCTAKDIKVNIKLEDNEYDTDTEALDDTYMDFTSDSEEDKPLKPKVQIKPANPKASKTARKRSPKRKFSNAEKKHECDLCGKKFLKKYNLTLHHNTHFKNKPFKCEQCEKAFTNQQQFKYHMMVHENPSAFSCKICGKCFTYPSGLFNHESVHSKEKRYKCTQCSKSYAQSGGLKDHILKAHSKEKYKFCCEICSKLLITNSELWHHMQKHKGEKKHQCATCGKFFLRPDSLRCHQRTHTKEKPYECSVCNKWFVNKEVLAKHKLIHDGIKPHVCTICDKKFTQKNVLTTHMRVHTGEQPYSCDICDKKFTYKQQRSNHMKKHATSVT